MSPSTMLLPNKSCLRWYTTTMHLVQRTSGLCSKTEMLSHESCKLSISPHNCHNWQHWLGVWLSCKIYWIYVFLCMPMSSEVDSFLQYRFRPRILIDVTKIDMTTTVLGFKISMPIMIAPTAMQKMAHPEGRQSSYLEYMLVFFEWNSWYCLASINCL